MPENYNNRTQWRRRSLLVFNALEERFYRSALESEADSLVFDLEDSVADSHKEEAREKLRELFPQRYAGTKELMVRVNNVRTPYFDEDVETALSLGVNTIMLPKISSPDDVKKLEGRLQGNVQVLALIENGDAYRLRYEILSSSPRITATALGAEDLASVFGVQRLPIYEDALINHMMKELVVTAKSLGVQYIDPPSRTYGTDENLVTLRSECEYLWRMGATGKGAIHPSQVSVINEIFGRAMMTVDEARALLGEFNAREGITVVCIDNVMQAAPSLRAAKKYLDKHLKP